MPSGSIITDQVQEWGSQEYGIQQTDGSGNLLYYDSEGNQTTDSTTGIPVIEQVTAGTAGAQPVFFNSAGQQVFGERLRRCTSLISPTVRRSTSTPWATSRRLSPASRS